MMFGLTPEEARAKLMAKEVDDLVELPSNCAPVIELAIYTSDQIRVLAGGLGPGAVIGFDLGAVDTAARWLGITLDADQAWDLREVHTEALSIMRGK